MTKQHNTFFLWNGYQIDPKITQNILYSHSFKSQNTFSFPNSRAAYHFLFLPKSYSSPHLVEDWMEELIVGLLLVENAWCQKQSWSFMHLLCSGMVGFGLRRKLGTAGTERDSPLVLPPWPGGILILLAGFVLFSTVVFLGDLEIYFFVPVSRQ